MRTGGPGGRGWCRSATTCGPRMATRTSGRWPARRSGGSWQALSSCPGCNARYSCCGLSRGSSTKRSPRRLGARAAERLDVESTAQAVVERLRTEPRADVRVLGWIQPAWLRIAAVLLLVIGASVVALNVRSPQLTTSPLLPPASAGSELSELSGDELRVVLEGLGEAGAERQGVSPQDVGLEDLSAPQLRALIESLEG